MGVTAALTNAHLSVAPGEEAVCDVQIHNTGSVVDQFTLDLVGSAVGWTVIEPSTINLFPGAKATAQIAFRPPRSAKVLAGPVPYGVRVLSREDPHGSVVEEGVVEVAPYAEMAVELVPRKSRGSRVGRHQLAIDNNGNHPLNTEVLAVDPENELQIRLDPSVLEVEPGTAALVKTRVKPKRRFLRGQPRTHPFQLVVVPEDGQPATADGSMVQEQLLPKWLLPALAAAAAAAVALFVIWLTLLKPAVKSIAKDQAEQQTKAVAATAQQAQAQAGEAKAQASQAAKAASSAAKPSGSPAPGTGTDTTTGTPTDFRIAAKADPVTDGSFVNFDFIAPDKQELNITDLVLQNPRGDTGILQLLIDGNVVLEEGLDNFRDLDYHYVVPLHVDSNKKVTVAVSCQKPGFGSQCTPSVSFSGRLVKP